MENKFAIVIAENKIADKLQSELADLGFSHCSVISSIQSVSEIPSSNRPNLVIVDLTEKDEYGFLDSRQTVQKLFESTQILYIIKDDIAKSLIIKDQLKKTNYITPSYSYRELELCIDALLIQYSELKTPNIWFDQSSLISLFNTLPNGILICDKTGQILSVNKTLTNILGYSRGEFSSMNLKDLIPPEKHDLIRRNISRVLNGESISSEVVNICKNGERKNLDILETKILLSNGKNGIMIISSDITHWKDINNALAESEEKYRILVEKSNDGIVFAQNGILVYANPKIIEMLGGIPIHELIGQPFHQFIHPSERDIVIERHQKRNNGERVIEIYETLMLGVNGDPIPVEFNVNMAFYQGKPTTMVFIRDISKRKLTEKYLKESEESYRSVFDNASEAIYIQDANGVFLDVNKAALNLYGYPKSEIVGSTPEKLSAPDKNDLNAAVKGLMEAFKGNTQIFEFWGLSKSGRIFPKEVILNKGKYFGKDVVIAMARDISERKNAEAILLESEEKYRTLAEQIPVGIYRTSEAGNIYYANPALAQILGYDLVEELISHNVSEFFATPIERLKVINSVKNSNGYIQSELRLIRKDGKKIWIRDNGKATFDNQGNLKFFDGVIENITAQKEANEALLESESNLRAMLKAIPDMLFKLNKEGMYLDFYAPSIEDVVITKEKIIGHSIREYFSPDICKQILLAIEECLSTGTLQTIEYTILSEGSLNHYEARIVPAKDNEVLSLARNITSKKKAEEKVNMLAQTIMNILECISITDTNNKLIYVNPALNETYGYEEDELIGKDISILRSPSVMDDHATEIFNCTLSGGWQGEILNIRKDGSEFPVSLSTAVVHDDKGKPIAFVGVANDITNRKIAEQDLIRAKEKAEESDKLKTAFLANMSHEIRSPMNAILGFIRIIKEEEKLSDNGKQYIDLISNSGAQLVSVIEDILDTSKIQANQLRLSMREFDLNALLTDLYTIYSAQVKEKYNLNTIMLPPTLSSSSPFLIISDDMRIRQIITNLLSNAIKFTSKGIIEFGYSVIIDDENPHIQFYVKDTGIGLSPDALELIFERFRQADDSYTRMYGGSGLGLAISKGLIELLGGKIWVESIEDKGSTFFFTLPLGEMHSQNTDKQIDNAKISDFVDSIEGLNWSDKTILIVEDKPEIQLFLKRVLLKTGVNLLIAASLKEAREIFYSKRKIDLILLDIRLPDGDGYDLSVEFKAQKPKIPIIAQTAYAMQGEKEKSIELGCDDFITKPINSDLLFLKIDSLLKKAYS